MPPRREFTIEEAGAEERRRLLLRGRLDMMAAPQLQATVARLCAGRRTTIVLDLRSLTAVDSAGMHALMAAYETTREHGHDLRVLPGALIEDVHGLADVLAGLPLLAPADG